MIEKELFQIARDILNNQKEEKVEENRETENKEEVLLETPDKKDKDDEVIEPIAIVSPNQISTPLPWKMSKKTLQNVNLSKAVFEMEHGILSGVPIICRTYSCPYKETCWIPENELRYGERCPIEIAAILDRYEKYKKELNIGDEDEIDKGLLKELVDLEVMILRCDNLLASKANLIDEVITTVAEDGTAYYKPEIAREAELKEKLRKERHRILQLLNSTRKDKKQQIEYQDPSSMVSSLIQKLKRIEIKDEVIDAEVIEET
ncbi:MAG: hypothetical protein N2043_02385 [Ignavibacterium sp.]|nr:hypothetical protein [Ignavibacterium sp.]